MNVGVFPFLIAALAVWRVSHLLTREDGPWDAIVRFRRLLSRRVGGQLLDCFYCLSLWVAVPAALWFRPSLTEFFVLWLALSGAACLLDRVTPEPVVIEHLPAPSKVGARPEQENPDVLLRKEPGGRTLPISVGDSTRQP